MNHAVALLLVSSVIIPYGGLSQVVPATKVDSLFSAGATAQPIATPAQLRIDGAKRQLQANPEKIQAYNDLALAYLKRSRETSNSQYLNDAEGAITQGLSLDPKDFSLQKAEIALLLAQHHFALAREKATVLNHRTPDDVMVYGFLAEAAIALGDLPAAERSTQWMLNMLPNNIPGLLLGARLRALFGDPDGAIEMLNMAYTETSPVEIEDQAWILNQMATVQIDSGKSEAAETVLEKAEQVFPQYPYTQTNLDRVRKAHRSTVTPSKATEAASQSTAQQPASSQVKIGSLPAASPRDVTGKRSTPIFSPVPVALLTPHSTDTARLIGTAQEKAAHDPKNANVYTGLGAAYLQQARETGDVSDYELAEKALIQSLDLVPSEFSSGTALQLMAEVCMGEHRFADALQYAERALSLGSGDVSPFAIVGDAYADMGEYEKAAAAYARLTPANAEMSSRATYARDSRLSYLRFVAGDTAAAMRLMRTAIAEGLDARLPSENLAWLYYELGEYATQAGDVALADEAYLAALAAHPGDYRALAGLGRLRGNQGRYADARVLYQKAIAVVPMPIFVAELGDLERTAGDKEDAKRQYQLVEYIGLLGHINQVLHNRDLALFYADHNIKLVEALELARKEFEVRHDIYTWDALSWALYKNSQYAEAGSASESALKFGTRDSLLLFHAAMIAQKLNRRELARTELREALQINPRFHPIYAEEAAHQLAALETHTASIEGIIDNHDR